MHREPEALLESGVCKVTIKGHGEESCKQRSHAVTRSACLTGCPRILLTLSIVHYFGILRIHDE